MDREKLIGLAEALAKRDRARRLDLLVGASRLRKLAGEAERIHRETLAASTALATLIGEDLTHASDHDTHSGPDSSTGDSERRSPALSD
jgi:hypothetical protein